MKGKLKKYYYSSKYVYYLLYIPYKIWTKYQIKNKKLSDEEFIRIKYKKMVELVPLLVEIP